ncbi:fluoride efflux transporter CrcB [Agreia pratensis]|uniref:Fluoride-specific ion channel FluC n=1 Tax=Agreia pratensis TaxID=150121 RepID=A0A1X7KS08_9MICO|nr:fluoride efflux transporter CrcB [Agreia pratensis]MBF4635738.1 fluoride efflux transporter CrcB [Agreia pratensis]SMG44118.1 camphor resistance protein CrcB [Agreia pratensis]
MTPLLFLGLSAAGGIGSVLRLIVDGTIKAHTRTTFPIGTMIINVTGALLLGFVTEIMLRDILPDAWRLIIGTGLLGGYTTFSTASFESVRLIQQHRYLSALVNSLGMLSLSIAAALTGAVLGGLL